MFPLVLSLLILTATNEAVTESRPAEAVELFSMRFDAQADRDYDDWPDGWTRQRGPGYPPYVKAAIARTPGATGGHAMRIDLNGGAAAVFSPPIPVLADASYLIDTSIKTAGLKHDEAFVSVAFLDERQTPLQRVVSTRLRGDNAWTKIRIGPMTPGDAKARWVVVGLHVVPTQKQDIHGTVWFDHLWVGKLPWLVLECGQPFHIHTETQKVALICRTSGLDAAAAQLRFELFDPRGRIVDQATRPLADAAPGGAGSAKRKEWKATWEPRGTGLGFYRAKVSLLGAGGEIISRETRLAVVRPSPLRPGDFGWTLPDGEGPIPLPALAPMLGQSGVQWLKFPIWIEEGDHRRFAALAVLEERLRTQGIELVGLLATPPKSLRKTFGDPESLAAADIFTKSPEIWYSSVEPGMTALSTRVRWWQLGADDDRSFIGYPQMRSHLQAAKKQFQQFGPGIQLVIGWDWIHQLPSSTRAPWEGLALAARPALTAEELLESLQATRGQVTRWVVLTPLAKSEYSTTQRIEDLVRRMLACKMGKAEAAFVPDPFDPQHGLLESDGTPADLYLPFRTTSLALAGAEYLGSVVLPGGSQNAIFSRENDAVMVIWNDQPGSEYIYLGEDAVLSDVWGATSPLPLEEGRQRIDVEPLPRFVAGINKAIIQLVMQAGFESPQLPSVLGVAHSNPLKFRNYFPQGAGGRVRIVAPDEWDVAPATIDFKLAAGEEMKAPVSFRLPFSADSGRQMVQLDFEIHADRKYKFRLERPIDVGLGDVLLDVSTRLNERGELLVTQRVTNNTDQFVNFKCDLSAPGRRLTRIQIWELGQSTDVQSYVLPNGEALVGQTIWVRATEIGGPRVLSRRVVVTR